MALLIDRIYQKVKSFVNTEVNGNVSPEEFNLFLHDAMQGRIEEYIYEIGRGVNKENRGLMPNFLENIPDRIREKMLHHYLTDVLAVDTPSTRTIPDDCRYIDEIESSDGTSLESSKSQREFNIKKKFATVQYPIYTVAGNIIRIAPSNSGLMNISYLRKPLYPKWTYIVVGGSELFNPSANDFVDADIHPSEENEMVRRVLMKFGVNLKEVDIQNFTINRESTEFNQENAV